MISTRLFCDLPAASALEAIDTVSPRPLVVPDDGSDRSSLINAAMVPALAALRAMLSGKRTVAMGCCRYGAPAHHTALLVLDRAADPVEQRLAARRSFEPALMLAPSAVAPVAPIVGADLSPMIVRHRRPHPLRNRPQATVRGRNRWRSQIKGRRHPDRF